ncbi:hypothetical protein RAS2_09620 [Phycisphaerae bacterium RAS2]|nr:hypothetical protein RAS2_09620 [Phycisphaerae bacterium RAS2]
MSGRQVIVVMTLLLGPTATSVRAQHQHGGHQHGKPVEFKMPTTYKGAVAEIRMRLHEIDALIVTKKLADVHAQADVIQKVGNVVGQLALKADSGVPKTAVKEVNKAGRALAAKFDAIDLAGDSGDAVGTRKVHGEMIKLAAVLEKYAPKDYVCPMRCEGEKTYPAAGKCPTCGMKLQDVLSHMDHSPKHGGVFFMAPDQTHHLEGTISATYEMRIYFYDEYTKPISADRFSGNGTLRTKEPETQQEIKLSIEPGKTFLTAKPHRPVKFPVSVKVFIDFKDGKEPQVFDFDFDGPSKPPAGHDDETKGQQEGKGHGGN